MAKDYVAPLNLPKDAKIDLKIERNGDGPGTEILSGKSITFRYRQMITVAKTGYRVHQILTGTDLPSGLSPAARAGIEQGVAASRDVSYEADASLTPVRMIDWQAQIASAVQAMSKIADSSPDAMRAIKAAGQQFLRMTPEQGAVTLREQRMVSIAQGLALDLHKTVFVDTQAANPLDGGPIKAVLSVTLENLDQVGKSADVHIHQQLDPETANQITRNLVRALSAKMSGGKSKVAEAALSALRIESILDCRANISIESGLATKTDCVSTITGVDQNARSTTRVDRWTISQTLVR